MGDRGVPRAEDGLAPAGAVSTVAAGDVDVVVRSWGDAAGRPLLFWHGLQPSGPLALVEAGPAWAERGFRVLAPSGPGMGETPSLPRERLLPSSLARLVVELADALGLDRFDYVGASWGATIGCHLAGAAPERLRSLVLLDAGYEQPESAPPYETILEGFRAQQEQAAFASWDEFLARAAPRYPRWRPALEERVRSGMVERDGRIVARSDVEAAAAAYHGVLVEPPARAWEALARLEAPLLLVLASELHDDLDAFRAAVPNAEVRQFADSGHDLLADAPDETIAVVADFLDR